MNLDPHQHTVWLMFATILAIYTFVVFCVPFNRKNAPLFSDRKMKHPSAFILTHINFLLILLAFMLFGSLIAPLLPNWMWTESSIGRHRNITEILCGLFFLALVAIERRFIIRKIRRKRF